MIDFSHRKNQFENKIKVRDILPRVAASVQATSAQRVMRIRMVQLGAYFFVFFWNQVLFPDADLSEPIWYL